MIYNLLRFIKIFGTSIKSVAFLFVLFPLTVFAQSETVDNFLVKFYAAVFKPFGYLMLSVAVVVFLWGLFRFIANSDNEEEVSVGKRNMMWGIIGITIIVSVWGIMGFICNTIGACG